MSDADLEPKSHLDEISTRWATLGDPLQFVMRYATAIRKYLSAILSNTADAEDVCQDFLTGVLARGFAQASPDRGRFRKYLKAAVRNAALMHLRKLSTARQRTANYEEYARHDESATRDDEWTVEWRACVIERAMNALHLHQRRSGEAPFHTVLRITLDFPDEDSTQWAARLTTITKSHIRADSFRKQLSRARLLFAQLIVREVAQTLEHSTADAIEDELNETGLMAAVHPFLPKNWKTSLLESP